MSLNSLVNQENPQGCQKDDEKTCQFQSSQLLAAKRRLLEQEVLQMMRIKNLQKQKLSVNFAESSNIDEDGYEEINFEGTCSSSEAGEDEVEVAIEAHEQQDEHHYLTPLVVSKPNEKECCQNRLNLSRKSNSDSDLLTLNENKEFEILCGGQDVTFNSSGEPEQGFYRVYDDLDRVRQWDLIPYVKARRLRVEEQERNSKEQISPTSEVESEAVCKIKKGESRVSLDSGHISLNSNNQKESARSLVNNSNNNNNPNNKRPHSDSGSNCSADSGTYNLFDEIFQQHSSSLSNETVGSQGKYFNPMEKLVLLKASAQLNAIKNNFSSQPEQHSRNFHHNRRPPPPPPYANKPVLFNPAEEHQGTTSRSPPPLPPRPRTAQTNNNYVNRQQNKKQKKLDDENSEKGLHSLKRKDLSSFFGLLEDEPNQLLSKEVAKNVALQNLEYESHFDTASRRRRSSTGSSECSPGKKDLKKFLGIFQEADMKEEAERNELNNSLLKRLKSPIKKQKKPFTSLLANQQTTHPAFEEEEVGKMKVKEKLDLKFPTCKRILDFSQDDGGEEEEVKNNNSLADTANEVFLVTRKETAAAERLLNLVASPAKTSQDQQEFKQVMSKSVQTSISPRRKINETDNENEIGLAAVKSCNTPRTSRRCAKLFKNPLRRSGGANPKFENLNSNKQQLGNRRRSLQLGKPKRLFTSSEDEERPKNNTPNSKRKSFMASLLHSASKDSKSSKTNREKAEDLRPKEEFDHEIESLKSGSEFEAEILAQNVREALKQGLPVIPFIHPRASSCEKFLSEIKDDSKANSRGTLRIKKACRIPYENATLSSREDGGAEMQQPPAKFSQEETDKWGESRSRKCIAEKALNEDTLAPEEQILRMRQISNLYLSMNRLPSLDLQPNHPYINYADFFPITRANSAPKPLSIFQQQHCQSCTCHNNQAHLAAGLNAGHNDHHGARIDDKNVASVSNCSASELDYVKMGQILGEEGETKKNTLSLAENAIAMTKSTSEMHF